MPTFSVTSPDGTKFKVNAPEGATQAQVLRYAQQHHTSSVKPSTNGPGGTPVAFVGNILDNVLPNWGDEIAGAARLIGAYTGSGRDPKTAYESGRQDFLAQQKRYKDEHPALNVATAGAGMGLGLVVPAGRLARGAGMGARIAHGAAVGAGFGALSGAGEGNTLADRAGNAGNGALVGGTVGAALAPLTSAAVSVARRARNLPGVDQAMRFVQNVPRSVMGLPPIGPGQRAVEQADRMMAQHMDRGNIQAGHGQQGPAASPQAIQAEVERRAATGVPAMPGDVTEPMRNLTSWASRGMGPGQTRVREAIAARKAAEASRVRQYVIDTMGPVGDPIAQVERHVRDAKQRVAPLYEQAYAQPMTVTPDIQSIMATPAFRRALPQAHENILNAQGDPNAMGLRLVPHTEGVNLPPNVPHMVTPEGVYVLNDGLSTEGFDQVIRAMRDSARSAMDNRGPVPVHTTNSVHIGNRARDLGGLLAEQNEPYRLAIDSYGSDMAQRDAMIAGQDVRKLTGHEITAQHRSMPDEAAEPWSIGARTALADSASAYGAAHATGDTAQHIRAALGDDIKQDALGQMIGNTGAVRDLSDRLESERQGNLLWRDVEGNSRTAHHQAYDAEMNAAVAGPSSFSVRGVMAGVVNHIASLGATEFRNGVKDRISRLATETNPENVRDLMTAIGNQAQRDRDFADYLHRAGVISLKPYDANIAPPNEN